MSVILATDSDSSEIMSLIQSCIRKMESQGIYQWDEHYPTHEIIQDDIQKKSLYVLKEGGSIIGIIVLNEEQSREWGHINWSNRGGKTLAVHRLAVNPKWQNHGIGRRLLDFAEGYAFRKGYASIRLDTYSGNPMAMRLYEKCGYKRVGQVHFPKRRLPFYCYDKALV